MIRRSFCHLAGIGDQTERSLWQAGVDSWDAARTAADLPARWRRLPALVEASAAALERREWARFGKLLEARHSWRWVELLRGHAVYLDIETTGGPPGYESVTAIACWDGAEARFYVRDVNLGEFPLYVGSYDLLVTYNGASFDVPHLRAQFPGLRLPPVHLDLRHPLAALGYRGGLKQIELATGLARPEELDGVYGGTAILLWRRHLDGDPRALPTLLRYAAEDVVGLEPLAVFVYNRQLAALPVAAPTLSPTRRRKIDLPYSLDLLLELKGW